MISGEGLKPTGPTTNDLQGTALTAQKNIDNLQYIQTLYEPEFLTYLGQGKAWTGDILNKINPANRNDFSTRAANFEQQTLQFFNEYRKWVTGVAAGEKEMMWLQDSIPSMGDSPQAFEAKIQTMIQRQHIVDVRAQAALRAGITPNGEGWEEFAKANPLDSIPTAQERGEQLEKLGYTTDQVVQMLRQEGY